MQKTRDEQVSGSKASHHNTAAVLLTPLALVVALRPAVLPVLSCPLSGPDESPD